MDVEPLGSDDLYIADVYIGNPPQSLKIALDTASSDLWMQSSDTHYYYNRDGPWAPQFKPNESRTSVPVRDAAWEVNYMDGTSARGIVYRDTVRLGEFTVDNITIQSAKSVTHRFEDETGLSGIMGLAKSLPSNIKPPLPSFLNGLKVQLDEPVFTADLRRNATGRFDFGYLDTSLASDNISWMDTTTGSQHWDVEFDLMTWNGGREKSWYSYPFNATIDTGTTLMFLPDALASMYWFTVPGMRVDPRLSNSYVFPCAFAESLPNLKFKIPKTEHVITIPGPYLNYGPVLSEGQEGYCWGGMQSAEGLEVTILGDVMLKAVFVAFDLEEGRVGFANKVLDDVEEW